MRVSGYKKVYFFRKSSKVSLFNEESQSASKKLGVT